MSSNQDHYAVLGVTSDAEDIVIRAAYKALAQRYHPDKADGDPMAAQRKMQAILDSLNWGNPPRGDANPRLSAGARGVFGQAR